MRFDDRLATVLSGRFDTPRERSSRWQQLADILAQDGATLSSGIVERCLRLLAILVRDVPDDVQYARAEAVACKSDFVPLITLLTAQSPAMARAIMPVAKLTEQDWLLALPHVGPVGRSLLRQRIDLSPLVVRALQYFAPGDLTLEATVSDAKQVEGDAPEIRDLVRRIEEFRRRQRDEAPRPFPEPIVELVDVVNFATDSTGRIADIEMAPRGRFVGLDLSQPAGVVGSGCDAGTARIVGKRGKIEKGRVLLLGADRWAGTWICTAEPRFGPEDGSFFGYVGTLRRPAPDEIAAQSPDAAVARTANQINARSELLRQLTHELRSPLNAISGFAQLIEGQFAGPVSGLYRSAATTILGEAARLVAAIDEIDLMARLDATAVDVPTSLMGFVELMEAVVVAMNLDIGRNQFFVSGGGIPQSVHVDMPGQVTNAVRLWLQPLAASAPEDCMFDVRLAHNHEQVAVAVTVTVPAASHDGSATHTPLGLAFAAAAQLAQDMGGQLAISGDQQILNLPAIIQRTLSEDRVG